MVTPVDAMGAADEPAEPPTAAGERHYQLTHDYLVPPLRQWLTRKQRETRKGRAELCLAERTALWINKPESKQLPSRSEWLGIRLLTRRASWTARKRTMMRNASVHHLSRFAVLLGILGLGVAAVLFARRQLPVRLVELKMQELSSVDLAAP